jgi:LPS-assembly protein
LGWDVTVDSDDTFRRFYQLDPILQTDRVNTVYLQGMSDRNYFSTKLYQFGGLLLTDTPYSNSWVHPVIDYNYIVGSPVVGGELSFTAHARSMTRSDGIDTNVAVVEANWRRQMIDPIGQVWTPFLNARGEIYNYNNGIDPITLAPLSDNTLALGIGAAGVLYSYPFVANSSFGSHVIAPTAQIIVRQNTVDQLHLPNEDAKSLVFDDTLLFEIDKFSGYDRMETGTRANVGMQYTFQANNGGYLRAVFGQSLHVAGENPYPTPGSIRPEVQLLPRQRAADEPLRLRRRRLRVAVQPAQPHQPSALRREGLEPAPPGYGVQTTYGPLTGSVAYTYSALTLSTGLIDTQQEIMTSLA